MFSTCSAGIASANWKHVYDSAVVRQKLSKTSHHAPYSKYLPMHCLQVPPFRNDKPLPRQQSLAVLTPVTTFPPQPVVSWHDWNCAVPANTSQMISL